MTYALPRLPKWPAEAIDYEINCAAELTGGETIASVVSIVSEPTGLTFGAATLNATAKSYGGRAASPANTVITTRISAGAGATKYKVRATYTTASGETRQAVVQLDVL